MLSDINACRAKEGMNPDVVFFTGDLAFSGQKEQYDQVGKWLDDILDACGLSGQRQQLFIVPGNHDVDWKVIGKLEGSAHGKYARGLLDSEGCKGIDDFLSEARESDREWFFNKFRGFAKFIDEFFGDKEIRFDHNRYYFVRPIKKDGHTVVVIGLNSTWLSIEDNEQGRLLLGEMQVCNALEESQKQWPGADLRIVLMHHPLYWMAEKDIHLVQRLLPSECHLLLRGHLHCPSFSIQSTPDTHLLEFAAGASLKSESEYRAYSLAQLDLDTGRGSAIVKFQHPKYAPYWGKDDFTYRNAEEGKITFSVKRSTGAIATEA
jgi:predicted phosphodiesterase